MSLIQELIHLNLNNLNIKYLNSCEVSYSFVLSTASGKLVAIGWHIADLFNEKEYSFIEKKSHLLVNYTSYGLMTLHEWNTWPGELFIINNRSIWHCNFNMAQPIGVIHNSLDLFVKNMKFDFPELRSANEISDEQIRMLSKEKELLQSSILSKSAKIEELQAQVNQLNIENSQLKKMLNSLGKSISPDSESL
jgi:hypothetical protein